MSKHLHVTLSVKRVRALNDVQLAAAVLGLMRSNFEVRHQFNGLQNYTFQDERFLIHVDGFPITRFLGDVEIIMAENAQYEREHGELRRANEHFSHEHVRLSDRIKELEAENADQKRRLGNQSDSIGHYQEKEERFEQRHASDAEAIQVIARQKGTLEEIIADLRAERENLMTRIESQRKTIIDFQQKQHSFNVEKMNNVALCNANEQYARELATAQGEIHALKHANETADEKATDNARTYLQENIRMRDELKAARADTESVRTVLAEWKDSNAQLTSDLAAARAGAESLQHSFKMADRALSARNETIAALEKLAVTKAQEHQDRLNVLAGTITGLRKSNANLSANVTHYALEAGNAKKQHGRIPVNVSFEIFPDGSVRLNTEAPVVVTADNVSLTGSINATGPLSS